MTNSASSNYEVHEDDYINRNRLSTEAIHDLRRAMASQLQLPGDDSFLLRGTHSNLTTFSSDVRLSHEVPCISLSICRFNSISRARVPQFGNLKKEPMWEGGSVVMLSSDEHSRGFNGLCIWYVERKVLKVKFEPFTILLINDSI
ncbi:hypothetical protein L1987_66714 [Smallanthus sonchifolius]|uniref:Uncharacterized protein n=1 Tax=Smallanthus sonchifolius TaxID=185202 RepID=A0ACB9BY36_9ASTR|nr:hypothetical protein L1987_66714 [Smallanthus sonchifolius]